MAYATYTTEAVVISIRDRMGADRMVRLLTEGAGLLDARAAGIREEKSKLRYALQPFSFARVTVVRGKREWRLTGAECNHNAYFAACDRSARAEILRLMKLVERLVHGEEETTGLFSIVADGLRTLSQTEDPHASRIIAFRLLARLGYVAPRPELEELVAASTFEEARALFDTRHIVDLDRDITHALAVSHL